MVKKIIALVLLFFPVNAFSQTFEMDAIIRGMRGENGSQNIGSHAMDASTDSIENIFDQPKADTLTEICLPYNTRNAGDPPAHTFSIQGVNAATGRADGTIKSSSNATCTMDPPSNGTWDNTVPCCTMTSSYAASAGERLALVMTCASCSAGNNGSWFVNLNGEMKTGYPTGWVVNAGSATKTSRLNVGGFGSATRFYGTLVRGNYNVNFPYSSGSTPDERGIRFNRNDGCTTYTLGPVTYMGRGPAAGTTATWTLYDTDGTTALATATIDGDVQGITPGTNDHYIFEFSFNATPTLTCHATNKYRIAMTTPDAAANIVLISVGVASSRQHSLVMPGMQDYTTRTDSGAWTNDDTARALVYLSYDSISYPAGGLVQQSGFNGGFPR